MDFVGNWHIYKIEVWANKSYITDYAYLKIEPDNQGEFKLSSLTGCLEGRLADDFEGRKRLEFTWEGSDEIDPLSGSSWVRFKEPDVLEGEFRIHLGTQFNFLAKRINQKVSMRNGTMMRRVK